MSLKDEGEFDQKTLGNFNKLNISKRIKKGKSTITKHYFKKPEKSMGDSIIEIKIEPDHNHVTLILSKLKSLYLDWYSH